MENLYEKDLTRLKQSTVKEWNQWRSKHPEIVPNLQGADLRKIMNLCGINFSRAKLARTRFQQQHLREVNFTDADLSNANLSFADLEGADLRGAQLIDADLTATHLFGAKLNEADVSRANFTRANLTKACLSYKHSKDAVWKEAVLDRTDLNQIDLQGADLRQTSLIGVVFQHANLNGAKMSLAQPIDADFRGANLSEADLRRIGSDYTYRSIFVRFNKANLSKANLANAHLVGADFRGANLSEANLQSANLQEADLSGAILNGTDFSKALMGQTILGDVDLRHAKGLETVQHNAPSSLGTDSLLRSEGTISEIFLRGVGLPDQLLSFASSLTTHPLQTHCFIHYWHEYHTERLFAEKLRADLQNEEFRCWLFSGKPVPRCDHLLIIYSLPSELSYKPIEWSNSEKKPIIIALSEKILQDNLLHKIYGEFPKESSTNFKDFTHWEDNDNYQNALKDLLQSMRGR